MSLAGTGRVLARGGSGISFTKIPWPLLRKKQAYYEKYSCKKNACSIRCQPNHTFAAGEGKGRRWRTDRGGAADNWHGGYHQQLESQMARSYPLSDSSFPFSTSQRFKTMVSSDSNCWKKAAKEGGFNSGLPNILASNLKYLTKFKYCFLIKSG